MKYSEYEEMKTAKDQDVPTGKFNYEEHEEKKRKSLRMKLIIGTMIAMVLFVVIIWCVSQSDANKKVRTTQTEEEKNVVIETTTQNTDIAETYSSANKSAEEIIQIYNDRIRNEDPNRSQDIVNSLMMSYTRQEYVAELDVTSYEYDVPSKIIGAYIFENADGKANFGGIELNTAVSGGTDDSTLAAFMTMCYYFAYGFDTTMTEDNFMKIWRDMRDNADSIAFYSGVTYQIQENGQYLSFNIQY